MDDPFKDRWTWCNLCGCAAITCNICNIASCTGGGCAECNDDYTKAIDMVNSGLAPTWQDLGLTEEDIKYEPKELMFS